MAASRIPKLGRGFANRSGRYRKEVAIMRSPMEYLRDQQEKGAIGYILLWAMGVPISVLLVIFLLRGCT
jgi:hypothetical protein